MFNSRLELVRLRLDSRTAYTSNNFAAVANDMDTSLVGIISSDFGISERDNRRSL
jgi:hypothetical protein